MSRSGLLRSGLLFALALVVSALAAMVLIGILAPSLSGGNARRISFLEAQAGTIAVKALKQDPRLEVDPRITKPVRTVFNAVADHLPPNPYRFTVFVVDSDEPNAFSMPGGVIVVSTALLSVMDGPEEVAAVFAHELSHSLYADAWRAMKASFGLSVLVSFSGGGGSVASLLRDFLKDAAFLSFSRSIEARSDTEASEYLVAAGIPPSYFADALVRLRAVVPEGGQTLELLSSHPDIDRRISEARDRAAALKVTGRPLQVDWPGLRAALPSAFSAEGHF